MLSFQDGLSRRSFLQVGACGLSSLGLSQLMAASGEDDPWRLFSGKTVIFLFQHGGPSQFETFDPKMSAPGSIRSMTGATSTNVPGTEFGGTMNQLAKHADKFTIVRSYQTGSSAHKIQPVVSADTFGANIGSYLSRIIGTNNPKNGMPLNVAAFPNAVVEDEPGPFNNFGRFADAGPFSKGFEPFVPGTGGNFQEDLKLHIDRLRLDDRKALLRNLDKIKRQVDADGSLEGLDKFQSQAFDVVMGGVSDAFDLSHEDQQTVDRYDTGHLTRFDEWKDKNNKNHYKANSNSLGKLMLLARRLAERGCGFITITTSFVWDMHADQNNLGMVRGMDYVGSPFDHAVAAFIEDVEARGLQDDILLVATGEMGRTPNINARAGRDHWGGLTPLLLYGTGIPRGHIIGQSAKDGGTPATTPVRTPNLIATCLHTLLDIPQLRLRVDVPGEALKVITGAEPIPGLG